MNGLPVFGLDLLAYCGVFLGALVLFDGLRQLLSRAESRDAARSRRLRLIARGKTSEDMLNLLKPRIAGWSLGRLPFLGTLPADIRHAGLPFAPGTALAISLGAMTVFAGAGSLFVPLGVSLPVAVFLFVVMPVAALRISAGRRLEALTRQLPDALDLMSRGLRVGHPLNTTIASVAREMPDPIASEFGVLVDQVAYGDDLTDAFLDLAERIDTEDVRFLAVSVAIQHGTGGDLARVLATRSRVIRDRISMRKKIKAISAEGRLSAIILSSIPFAIIAITTIMVPGYYGDIMEDPAFRPTAAVVFGLVLANALVLRRLVNFRF